MKIYFMGICGTAMGNIALMLQQQGHTVIGADTGIYPPMSDLLQQSSIELLEGYSAKRLASLKPDLVVVGNVISRGNEEIEWLLETNAFPYISLPELMHEQLLKKRKNIVASGTHGKTTTSTIAAYLLLQNKINPGFFIGGVPKCLPSGAQLGGNNAPFVLEGDEYDSAFFDKRSKFIHYLPSILMINNIEFDHADIFHDLKDVQRTFSHCMRLVPRNGYILINAEDPNTLELLPAPWTQVLKVGFSSQSDLRIDDYQDLPTGSSFKLYYKGTFWTDVSWPLSGTFNARNAAMASLASALAISPENPTQFDITALSSFNGVQRRQDILFQDNECIIMEDFGHHPTAIRETLRTLQNRYPNHTLIAAFEPRSNTASSRVFQNEFTEALGLADQVYMGCIGKHNIPSEKQLDTELIALNLNQQSIPAIAFGNNADLLKHLERNLEAKKQPTLVCFFTNGSFDGIMHKLVERVQTALKL